MGLIKPSIPTDSPVHIIAVAHPFPSRRREFCSSPLSCTWSLFMLTLHCPAGLLAVSSGGPHDSQTHPSGHESHVPRPQWTSNCRKSTNTNLHLKPRKINQSLRVLQVVRSVTATTSMTDAQDKDNIACFLLDNPVIGFSLALVRNSVTARRRAWKKQDMNPHQAPHATARHFLEQNQLLQSLCHSTLHTWL